MTLLDIVLDHHDRGMLIVVGFLVLFAIVTRWEQNRKP